MRQQRGVRYLYYWPPRSTMPKLREFIDELAPVMNCLDIPNHNVILAGYYNINLLEVCMANFLIALCHTVLTRKSHYPLDSPQIMVL